MVDSSPALWGSTQGSEKTTVMLLVDPHCSYEISAAVSVISAASRFLLLYCSQIIGFSIAVIFFALMRQARAWELDLPLPSMLAAVESNLRVPLTFLLLAIVPILISLVFSSLASQPFPPFASFIIVSIISYSFANGSMIILILISQLIFYVAAVLHVFIRTSFFSLKAIRILRGNPTLVTALIAITLVCFVHPALGLFILLLYHALCCHDALCRLSVSGHKVVTVVILSMTPGFCNSFLAASFRSHAQRKELFDSKTKDGDVAELFKFKSSGGFDPLLPLGENSTESPNSAKSFGETQLEIFNYRHGMLMLHLLATLMFVPSLVAWLQRTVIGPSFPWFLDSALCVGVILHGLCWLKPEFYSPMFLFPGIQGREFRLSFVYLLAGYYSYISALALAPYRAFYAMAAAGAISTALRIIKRRNREKEEAIFTSRKHSHRH
ncbi:hypothetical protein HHK36_033440 [Tetracentron sinense]|uniref:Uncharacterized protein n=1 Tax=Tetracentron sinense TaxID=13715 RepID=A0A834Y3G5_TETSI|nr:hypothetical protein HHK36_033440 [Tetracentron sinense]